MELKYYVELPWDEFNNRGYTNSGAWVISAYYKPGTGEPGTWGSLGTLHVVEPEHIKTKWPTMSERSFKEVSGPARPLTEEEWLELVKEDMDKKPSIVDQIIGGVLSITLGSLGKKQE